MFFCVYISVRHICLRCRNEDARYFYHGSKGWYCRKCISFKRVLLNEVVESQIGELGVVDGEYSLGFSLTKEQVEVSKQILWYLRNKQSVLVSAVCGAGKVSQLVMGV